ncbi:MAG: PD40 domain-containing protein [Planctomycetes bacterium]|nr:PD40 domain-containing protein [Planctomycetota bacterium]
MVKRLLIGLCVIALAGVGTVAWHVRPIRHKFYTDADTIKEPIATAIIRHILWQPAVKLPYLINSVSDDYEPRLSADGTVLFFVRGKAGQDANIYVARRTPQGWSDPEPVAAVNSDYDDLGPEPSADGLSLYFYSDRPGGSGGYDLWVAHSRQYNAIDFSEPINLGPQVNSEYNDYGPALTPDGKMIYFSSNRPQGDDEGEPNPDAWPATLREDLYHRDYDLYVASITERGFGTAHPLIELNSPHNEGAPAVSPAGDFVYFSSDRPGGEGGFDLYRSRRLHGDHQPPTNLGLGINTAANELDPSLSLGGFGMHFSSDRVPDAGAVRAHSDDQEQKDYDLYYAASREVFSEVEETRASINWGLLWSDIGPNLLWLLLALLLLLLLLALIQGAKDRTLSLLAKCLLASLFAHLLVMFLLNFWEVTATLADAFRRRGGIQIALVSSARGEEIATQLRGQWTDVDTPAPVEFTAERQPTPLEMHPADTLAELTVDRRTVEWTDQSVVETTATDAP